MIGFNPCSPCCEVLEIRVRIAACFLEDRHGNFDPPYTSIKAEFFDDDDNSVFVVEDEYDEKKFELPGSYKGKLRSVATGISSKGESFNIEQVFPNYQFPFVLVVDAGETENFVCCGHTWIPKTLTGKITHGEINRYPDWIDGTHLGPILEGSSGPWWYIYTRFHYENSIEDFSGEEFLIKYNPAWKIWLGVLKAITYNNHAAEYAYGGMADVDGTLLSTYDSSGTIYVGISLNLCRLIPNPLPYGVLNDMLNGFTWDTNSSNYEEEDFFSGEQPTPYSFFGYVQTNLDRGSSPIGNEVFSITSTIQTINGLNHNVFNPDFLGFQNGTITIS